jgi:hypothetical protein
MQNEEEIFERPTLERASTRGPMTLDELDIGSPTPKMTLDELDIGSPKPKMTLDELNTTYITRPVLTRGNNNLPPFETNPQINYQGVKLEREIPSDYGVFNQHMERDVNNWFDKCSNEKRGEYIKYLTELIVTDSRNTIRNLHSTPQTLQTLQTLQTPPTHSCSSLEPEPMTRQRRLGSAGPPPFPNSNLFSTPPRDFNSIANPFISRASPRNMSIVSDEYSSDNEFMDVEEELTLQSQIFDEEDPLEESHDMDI